MGLTAVDLFCGADGPAAWTFSSLAPCQGFSIIGSRVVWDERNNLFKEVLRLARELRPRCVVIENVPGLVTLGKGAYLHAILERRTGSGRA